jgi:hypothetical protein
MKKITVKVAMPSSGNVGWRTLEIDDSNFLVAEYTSDELGNKKARLGISSTNSFLNLNTPHSVSSERSDADAVAKDTITIDIVNSSDNEIVNRFLDSSAPCFFPQCEDLRKNLAAAIAAAGGEGCTGCELNRIKTQFATRALKVARSSTAS